ncbi:hypothetical protein DL771_003665 [Monosporascus sp. 5C6A]|nr:hypothetical protein DL771_003665 [Monosporascus sp. 5C6A]
MVNATTDETAITQQRQSEAHFIPDGLEDLYNLPANRHQAGYAAAVDQSDMAEIMQLFDRAMEQQQDVSPQGLQAPEGAIVPEGVASGGPTPGVSTPCSSSSQHSEDTGSTGTSKKLLAYAPSNASVDELVLRLKNELRDKPQDEPRALIFQLHNVQKENRNEILWDLGANVFITNNSRDYLLK